MVLTEGNGSSGDGTTNSSLFIAHRLIISCTSSVQNISTTSADGACTAFAMIGCKSGHVCVVKLSLSNQLDASEGEATVCVQETLPSSPKATAAQKERWWTATYIQYFGSYSRANEDKGQDKLLAVAAGWAGQLFAAEIVLESDTEPPRLEWKSFSSQNSPAGHSSTIFGISIVEADEQVSV